MLPEPPSPLGWDIVWENGTILGWRDCAVNRLGFADDELSQVRPEVSGLFGGYAYLNASLNRVFGYRAPGMTASTVDDIYFGDHPDVPPVVIGDWWDSPRATAELEGWMNWALTTTEQPDLEHDREVAEAARANRPDFSTMSNTDLIAFATSHIPTIRRMFDQHINQSACATIGPGIIAAVAEAVGDPTLTLKIIGAVGDVDSAAPSYAMWDLSRLVANSPALTRAFDDGVAGLMTRLRDLDDSDATALLSSLDDFMFRFGSRGPNEWDLHAHVWETKPELVLSAIDRMRFASDDESPERRHADREHERDAIVAAPHRGAGGRPRGPGPVPRRRRLGGPLRAGTRTVEDVDHQGDPRVSLGDVGARPAPRRCGWRGRAARHLHVVHRRDRPGPGRPDAGPARRSPNVRRTSITSRRWSRRTRVSRHLLTIAS